MKSLTEMLEAELEIGAEVLSHRSRSFYMLLAAFAVPSVMLIVMQRLLAAVPISSLEEGLRPGLLLFGVVLMLKFVFLAVRTYLKDRAELLRS